MNLKTKCDCGGSIIDQHNAPTPIWFCDRCTRMYALEDLIERPTLRRPVPIGKHEHVFVCIKCGLTTKYNEDEEVSDVLQEEQVQR